MYIQKVKIRNVRGFKEIDLDFTRPDGSYSGWTVLAGRNGSGKSSMLRVLAATLIGPRKAQVLSPNLASWLRESCDQGAAEIDLELAISERLEHLRADADPRRVRLTWTREGDEPSPRWKSLAKSPLGELDIWRQRFLAGYGPYRRLTGSTTEAQNLMMGPALLVRLVTLFREDASLIESVTWLRDIYLRRLEEKPGAAKLERAVLALLNDGLLPDGLFVENIDSDGLWICQNGVRLSLMELSDGYRTTAALVMDMVRHLHGCFGELRIEDVEDGEAGFRKRLLYEGVVLIDEVDLHLHISWQKRIGFWLKRHFPNIQFIVTTHSPFVCQAADPRGLIRLPAPGEKRPAEHVSEELYNTVVNGSLDEAVLTDLFGLETPYSDQTEKLRERVGELEARLQSGEATLAEEEEFDRLSAQLPQSLPSAVEQALRKLAADV